MKPPPLKNDCFALPPGVDWVPVDQALADLRARLSVVCAVETRPVSQALGRFLAVDAVARRSNPPAANSAVDGYGFAGGRSEGTHQMRLVPGRAAAGAAFDGTVPAGQAIRILTGAALPPGVDTVVLEEDCSTEGDLIGFRGPLKSGANTRRAGEDVTQGAVVVPAQKRLRPAELAILSATGLSEVATYRQLRVGVLSTGDEIMTDGADAAAHQIYDANRPMLLSLVADWGYAPVDLGHVPDDRAALRARLDQGAAQANVILTSGGASAGDEDHVSRLLTETGSMAMWRIALKPGRPLALGMWGGVPVFGLPGNPVAALVCSLVFAAPVFRQLAGGVWSTPQGFQVPAAFTKNKKPGRREFLRARLNDEGHAEVFQSEGSGRISGLAWAEGLVEIGDAVQSVTPGQPVRYIPYSSFF